MEEASKKAQITIGIVGALYGSCGGRMRRMLAAIPVLKARIVKSTVTVKMGK